MHRLSNASFLNDQTSVEGIQRIFHFNISAVRSFSKSRDYSTSAVACLIPISTETTNMTVSEKPPVTTAQDDDESDWDDVGGDDEKSRLLSSPDSSSSNSSRASSPEPTTDSHFSPPPPSPLKRFLLLTFVVLLLLVGFQMRSGLLAAKKKPKVIHASRLVHELTPMFGWNVTTLFLSARYSKEYKFRPAASPIITETLKDGRVRLRGALPTPTETTTPVVTKKKKAGAGKATGKRKARKPKRKQGAGSAKRI